MRGLILILFIALFQFEAKSQLGLYSLDSTALIDFNSSILNVHGASITGGFFPVNVNGVLNSNAWSTRGWSDGDMPFGGQALSSPASDRWRGFNGTGVTNGGCYYFNLGGSNHALGAQLTNEDFTPGSIVLKMVNLSGVDVDSVYVEYDIIARNNQDISNSFNFSHSADDVSYNNLSSVDYVSPELGTGNTYIITHKQVGFSVSWLNGAFHYLSWNGDSVSGTGLHDELAIDNIQVTAYKGSPVEVVSVNDSVLCLDAVGDSIYVSYDANVAYSVANVFSVQLSDSSGSFATYTTIGSVTSPAITGTIGCFVPAGTALGTDYKLRVIGSDSTGFSVPSEFSIAISTYPAAIDSVTNVTCFGDQNGAIALTMTEGVLPLSFSWSSGDSTENMSSIDGGYYDVTLSDTFGCVTHLDSIFVYEPEALQVFLAIDEILCHGDGDGSVDLTVAGGNELSGYTYHWNDGDSVEDIHDLGPGNYAVTVADSVGCSADTAVLLTQPDELEVSYTSENVLCYGAETGSIQLTVNGGATPYDYLWSNNEVVQNLSGIAARAYNVTITDDNDCNIGLSGIEILQEDSIQVGFGTSPVSCVGCSDGSIQVIVVGALPPYEFQWSNGSMEKDQLDLAAGSYTLTITDANMCEHVFEQTVTDETTGIKEVENMAIAVYPNPATGDQILVQLNNESQLVQVEALNLLGASTPLAFNQNANKAKVSVLGLTTGIYMLVVTRSDNRKATIQLIIKTTKNE